MARMCAIAPGGGRSGSGASSVPSSAKKSRLCCWTTTSITTRVLALRLRDRTGAREARPHDVRGVWIRVISVSHSSAWRSAARRDAEDGTLPLAATAIIKWVDRPNLQFGCGQMPLLRPSSAGAPPHGSGNDHSVALSHHVRTACGRGTPVCVAPCADRPLRSLGVGLPAAKQAPRPRKRAAHPHHEMRGPDI